MTDFSISFGVAEGAHEGLQSAYNSLTSIGTELTDEMKAHTSELEGTAKDAFVVAQGKYDTAYQELTASLNAATVALEQISGDYQLGGAKATQMWTP
jgi:uncharacterized protein YukE